MVTLAPSTRNGRGPRLLSQRTNPSKWSALSRSRASFPMPARSDSRSSAERCTALSCVKILEQCPSCYDKSKPVGKHMEGQVVTVINRSEIVGRPLAASKCR